MIHRAGNEVVTTITQDDRDQETVRIQRPTAHAAVVAVPPGDKAVAVPEAATAVTATVWEPWVIAMARGLGEAVILAGITVFTMLAAVPDASGWQIFIVAGGAFFTKLGAAYGIGIVDQRTATKG